MKKVTIFGVIILFTVLAISSVAEQYTNSLLITYKKTYKESSANYSLDGLPEMITMEMLKAIMETRDKYNVPASITLAQLIQESRGNYNGLSLLAFKYFNLFGIKGTGTAGSVNMSTGEQTPSGSDYTIVAGFRVYHNHTESVIDHAELLSSTMYTNLTKGIDWKTKSGAQAYGHAIGTIYATDGHYGSALTNTMNTYDLYRYDTMTASQAIESGGQGNAEVSKSGWAVPLPSGSYTITSPYGSRGGEFHRGLDMGAAQGTPIMSVKEGAVITSEYHYSWGNHVVVQHKDGTVSLYAHMVKTAASRGVQVKQGQIIGYVGNTGNSFGAHLHLEICKNSSLQQGLLVDPYPLLFN